MEAIPVYWSSLLQIPKGIPTKIRKKCCRYLWPSQKEGSFFAWVKWERISLPKNWRGWGLKNIHLFVKSLATKVSWRQISSNNLWTEVEIQKYIIPLPLVDWICMQNKQRTNVSIIWKVSLQAFGVIERGLAWKVGNGTPSRNWRKSMDWLQ